MRLPKLTEVSCTNSPAPISAFCVSEEQLAAEESANKLFDRKLAEEEVWIRQGIKARRTRNEGRVRALEAMREERRQRRSQQGKASFEASQESDLANWLPN